jgi:hypothetical protein
MEKYPKTYNGALALCPLSSRPYEQMQEGFDDYVLFNAIFPGYLPSLATVMSGKAAPVFSGGLQERVKTAMDLVGSIQKKQPEALLEFLHHQHLKLEDLPMALQFLDGMLRDVAAQTGGNPFDNTNTLYTGFPNDWVVNQNVERLLANASSDRLTTYDRTGLIEHPVLIVHTSYDQLINPRFGADKYDDLVHQMHREQFLKVFYTNGQGHCNFTMEQTATAFNALRAWAASGQKPSPIAIASPPPPHKDTLCYELRIYTCNKGKLNDLLKRFRNHTTKLFEQHGMTNVGYWTPLDNPEEKLYYVLSYPNRAAREASWTAFNADTTWQRVWKDSEANGSIVSKVESIFLKSTDFSPNNFKNSLISNVWELRIYHVTPNNLDNLLDRFRGFTVDRFAQYGMTSKIYWTPTDAGQGAGNTLYYFLTHPSQQAAKAAFDQFRNDPEWISVRKASEVKGGGSLTSTIESVFMYPTDFSPVR